MRPRSSATPGADQHRQAHAGQHEDDRLHDRGAQAAAAGEQRAVIGQAVPDDLVAGSSWNDRRGFGTRWRRACPMG